MAGEDERISDLIDNELENVAVDDYLVVTDTSDGNKTKVAKVENVAAPVTVAHALTADEATHAADADTADEATHAADADTADEATHAADADTADEATEAGKITGIDTAGANKVYGTNDEEVPGFYDRGSGGGAARNFLVNGGFDYFQRTVPGTWTSIYERVSGSYPTTRKLAADMWALQINQEATDGRKVEARRYDYSLSTDNPGPKVMAMRRSAVGRMLAINVLETFDSRTLVNAGTVTFSVKLKAVNNGMTVRLGLIKWSGTANATTANLIAANASWSADPALVASASWIANSDDINVTTSDWVEATLTVDLSSHSDLNNLAVCVYTPANTTAANDVLACREAGLYIGSSAPDWSPVHPADELVRCQRYCYKTYAIDTPPGSVGAPQVIITTSTITTGSWYGALPFKATMLKNPSVTIYSYNGVAGRSSDNTATDYGAGSATPTGNPNPEIALFYNNSGTSMTIGAGFIYAAVFAEANP